MWRDAWLVAGKDLRVELRSRVGSSQVLPFALVVLILFAIGLDPNTSILSEAAPGLYWVAVCFAAVLAVQRSLGVETRSGSMDGLRMSGLDPAGIFLGKMLAVGAQLLVMELVLGAGVTLLYGVTLYHVPEMLASAALATVGLSCAGVLYGILAGSLHSRETLLPLLLLPVLVPVLVAGAKCWSAAMSSQGSLGHPWLALLAVFAAMYLVLGCIAFGPLLETA